MKYSVLTGKLHKPELPAGFVARRELPADCGWANVVLVCAQAGSGKSTAVSEWLSEQNKPYCWYSLDKWDNDPVQFLSYLVTAVKTFDESAYGALEQLLDAYSTVGFDAFLRALVYQLHTIAAPFILVLDDYHLIDNEQIHLLVKTLLEHFPPAMQLCIITREDPPLPLARLRAGRKLLELRIANLRFTGEQVKAYFIKQLGVTLEEEQLMQLLRRTEGWAAGLQMTALSMQGVSDIGQFMQMFSSSDYYMMDYLLEEVLDRHTAGVKAFLLSTSVLESFSAPLCDELLRLAPGASGEIIQTLVKTNSFIIPLDSPHRWYRYHHLFRDLLRQRLERRPPEEAEGLHLRAGLWFAKNGRDQEAIHHLLKGNAAAAAGLIERKWAEMDVNVQSAQWLDMASKLPEAMLEQSPVLAMGFGWAMLDKGEVEACQPWFQKARALYDRRLSTPGDGGVVVADELQFQLLPATIASGYAYIAAATGDFEGTFTYTREALRLIPADQYFKRGMVSILLGIAYWRKGDLREAGAVLTESLKSIRSLVTPFFENSYQLVITELNIQLGELDKAKAQLEQTIARVTERKQAPIILASLYLGLAKIAFLRGDNAGAYALLDQSKAHGQMAALMDWRYQYNLLLARIYTREGLFELARDCVREGKASFHRNPVPYDFSLEDAQRMIDAAEEEGARMPPRQAAVRAQSFLREHANQALPEPLTVRELEVLELIIVGCSNEEICNKLFLALSTVKSYNQHIFGKLGVSRRTQAAARAKELGLV